MQPLQKIEEELKTHSVPIPRVRRVRGNQTLSFLPPEIQVSHTKRSIQWDLYGIYKNENEVKEITRMNKVSKRKTDELLSGSKVTYRCNAWKRTRCPFQMYALTMSDNQIYLYKGGEHYHGGLRIPGIKTIPVPKNLDDLQHKLINDFMPEDIPGPSHIGSSATVKVEESQNYDYMGLGNSQFMMPGMLNGFQHFQTHVPQSMMTPQMPSMAFAPNIFEGIVPKEEGVVNTSSMATNVQKSQEKTQNPRNGTTKIDFKLPSPPIGFRLMDRKTELLQIADEYSLGFSFNRDINSEITFSSQEQGKTLVLTDFDNKIIVEVKAGSVIEKQTLKKTEWMPLSWQIRGMCLHFLKNIGRAS